MYSAEALRALAEIACKHDLWVISDEIYARIVYDRAYESIAALPGMRERAVIIDGFSKSFAMTGWRLGYAVAPPDVVAALHLLVMNTYTCASEFIQRAAVEALCDASNAVARMVAEFAQRRAYFADALNGVPGFRCARPDGAFYAWVNVRETGLDAPRLAELLLEDAGVAGIPGGAFGEHGRDYLRFSFASSMPQLERAVERMKAAAATWRAMATR